MHKDDMILISVDDHIVEPPDMFKNHLAKKYLDEAPRLVHNPDGSDTWQFRDVVIPNVALNAVAGRPKEEYGLEPQGLDEIRPGCWKVDDRVKDMNAGGILGSMCFPSFPGFAGRLFATEDAEFSLALVQAYNDWHVEEWCGAYPARFIPMTLPVIWDPEACAAEIRRNAARGVHSLTFSENPSAMGYPSFHDFDHWKPMWDALVDTDTVLNVHIGSSGRLAITAPDAPMDVMITLQPMNIVQAASDLVWSRVLQNFPDLRVAMSEGGIGWIPYFLERADYVYKHHKEWTGTDLGMLPSELFNERIITCFIDDAVGMENRHHLNIDHITWECDYPHSDSTWPVSPELLYPALAGVPDEEINKITHENAMRLFSYDPFAHLPKDQCTVAALRALATDVDVSEKAVTGALPRDPSEPPITVMTLAAASTAKKS
jgi:predicted TIM-barrel fold metal-dependent hydrolase